jgi:hypothetical protein
VRTHHFPGRCAGIWLSNVTRWLFGDQAQPGSHALVVGVGDYPALLGGTGPLYPKHGGMGQLTSAPASALAFTSWLTDPRGYRSATSPLRSLELLISGGPVDAFQPPGASLKTVTRATFASYRQAILDWHARATESARNRTIFYFCGHGILGGLNTSLLLEDFGIDAQAALDSAHDFTLFHLAMDQCKAREQLYLVDACRVASTIVLHSAGNYGRPILTPDKPTTPKRKPPVVYSTLPGAAAYGRTGKASFFTEALLEALDGGGAGKIAQQWRILPSVLYRAVDKLLAREIANTGAEQACTVEPLVDFPLHDLDQPSVPVLVSLNPPVHVAESFRATRGPLVAQKPPPFTKPSWMKLPPGEYAFEATDATGVLAATTDVVYPPFAEVELP